MQSIIVLPLVSQSTFHCLFCSKGARSYKLVTFVANMLSFVNRGDCRSIAEWKVSLSGSGVLLFSLLLRKGVWREDMQGCSIPPSCPVCSPKASWPTQAWQALYTPGLVLANELLMLQLLLCTYLPASAQLYIGWVFSPCQCELWFPSCQLWRTYTGWVGGVGDVASFPSDCALVLVLATK